MRRFVIIFLLICILGGGILINQRGTKEHPKSISKNSKVSHYQIGDVVKIGKYNEKDITWEIIQNDLEAKKVLVRAQEVFECMPYNDIQQEVTWEDSSLRGWLNQYFYNNCFSEEEKQIIAKTELDFDEFSVIDWVFIPQYNQSYDKSLKNHRARATYEAFKNGLILYHDHKIERPVRNQRNTYSYTSSDKWSAEYSTSHNYCDWWLLSEDGLTAEYIDGWGNYHNTNIVEVYTKAYGVRPMMWLQFDN